MKNLKFISAIVAIVLTIGFTSCEKDDFEQGIPQRQDKNSFGKDMLKSAKSTANISRSRMVNYALTYTEQWTLCNHVNGNDRKWCTKKYNLNYKNYATSQKDCANFASQVLKYGRLPEDSTWKYNNGNSTNAWVGARALYNYLTEKYQSSVYLVTGTTDIDYSYYLDDAKVGDLVFYLKSDNGNSSSDSDHVSIVTGVVTGIRGATNIKLSGHTNNERNYGFNENYLQYYPNKTYRIVRL